MIGKVVSHYKILEKLGEGGMGVVYKAEDLKLNRTVALKFLPQQIAVSLDEVARFQQEARAISALNHPNISTIFDIDETEGPKFLVLEYIPGGTLKSKLKHLKSEDKEFSLSEVLEYGIQAAEALAHAHRHQIIHRDVKTDNLMLTEEGKLKLTDFGLAKLRGSVHATKTGTTVGTAAYMSPEQVRGEEVDQRSDIFSLGVVLYELATSHLPFRGEFETALSYSILNEDPAPVKSLRKDSPPALDAAVARCLQKEKAKRYQNADDIVSALRGVQQELFPVRKVERKTKKLALIVGGAVGAIAAVVAAYLLWPGKPGAVSAGKSIAVLPFVDMTPQKDQEYFCDGMTEDLINRLSNIQELKVPARTSVFTFKGKTFDIKDIGSKLGVQTVLEGSVQKSGDRVRITAQLINAADGYHLWSEKYDRKLEDIFAVQDELSSAIVNALKVKLTADEKQRVSERPIENVAAYECYLRAANEIWRFKEDALDRAVQDLQNGLHIVGDNPLLYAAMAEAYYQYVNIGIRQEDFLEKAEGYAKKALAMDPNSSRANSALARIYELGNQPREGIRYFRKALALNPSEPGALRRLALIYLDAGKPSLALPLIERNKQIDPLNSSNELLQGSFYQLDGQFGPALDAARRLYQSDPENPIKEMNYAIMLATNKEIDSAFSIIDRCVKADPTNIVSTFGLLLKHGLQKEKEKAFRLMTPDFQRSCRRDGEWSLGVAEIYAVLDEKNEALDWLENAANRGIINYPFLNKYDPFLKNIRSDERFKKLMERVKYEWEHFEVPD